MNEAADEIERLRRVVHTIAGYISTLDEYKTIHPEAVYQFFYDKA
jgi:hypothetical protein